MLRQMFANKFFLPNLSPTSNVCSKIIHLCAKHENPSRQEINFMMKIMKGSKNPKM